MKLDLPYPAKELWPNGRPHHMAKARAFKKHKQWAADAALVGRGLRVGDGPVPIKLMVSGKPSGPLPDADNCVSAAKAYLDGIAARIGINDRNFAAPTVEFSEHRGSRFIITVGEA